MHSPHFHTDCFRAAAAAAGARYAAFNDRRDGFKPPHWSANFALDTDAVFNWLARLPPDIR